MKFLCASILAVMASSASALTVNYDLAEPSFIYSDFSGTFTGQDGNNDGFLSIDELSSFSGSAFVPFFGIPGLGLTNAPAPQSFLFEIATRLLDVTIAEVGSSPCIAGYSDIGQPIQGSEGTLKSFSNSGFLTENLFDPRYGPSNRFCGQSPQVGGLAFSPLSLNIEISQIPVPASGLLLTTALGLILLRRRKP